MFCNIIYLPNKTAEMIDNKISQKFHKYFLTELNLNSSFNDFGFEISFSIIFELFIEYKKYFSAKKTENRPINVF